MKQNASNSIPEGLSYIGLLVLVIVLISLAGCNQPIAEDQATEPVPDELGELGEPGEPGEPIVIVEDARSDGENGNWMAQYIVGGVWADTWFTNQYERPFSAYEMVYQAHLDIQEARIRPAGEWTVFEIQAVAPPTVERVHISLELDTDLDNRPDYLILTRALEETTWNDSMVTILVDINKDAGGNRPRLAEPFESTWNGFEDYYESDVSRVFVRRSPDSDSVYQIAVLNELIGGDQYVWRVWLEGEIYHPGWVEYNDRISFEEAGSPYLYSRHYPLKNLASLDNTCLHFFGGEANNPQPGFCGTLVEVSGEQLLPPDDQYQDPGSGDSVLIIFPSGSPGDEDDGTLPPKIVFDPGYFNQPTPTPYPHLAQFPTMEFTVPEATQEGVVEVLIATAYEAQAVVAPTNMAEAIVAPTYMAQGVATTPEMLGVPATDMFDPYAGSTPPPTEMFDPYQGSSPTPTPKPVIHFSTKTPTRPVIIIKPATPTDKPIIFLKPATPTP